MHFLDRCTYVRSSKSMLWAPAPIIKVASSFATWLLTILFIRVVGSAWELPDDDGCSVIEKNIAFFSGSKIAVQSFLFSLKRFFSCIGIPPMKGSPDLHPQHFNRKQLLAINILLSLQSKGADHYREPKMGQFWPLALAHTLPKAEQ